MADAVSPLSLLEKIVEKLAPVRDKFFVFAIIITVMSCAFSWNLVNAGAAIGGALTFGATIAIDFVFLFFYVLSRVTQPGTVEEQDFTNSVRRDTIRAAEASPETIIPQVVSQPHVAGHPLVLAFVSGKGGVGKTVLATASAHELAKRQRTLLVDLDLFNRGMSGLLPGGKLVDTVPRPPLLPAWRDAEPDASWAVEEIEPNLLFVRMPELIDAEAQRLERGAINRLQAVLETFLRDLAAKFDCKNIILDCHGGPDPLSFAACAAANYTLLVSEPDRVSFHGTMIFLRRLRRVTEATSSDVRLVFNRVIPTFSGRYLQHLYDTTTRKFFGDRPLAGIFPLELQLAKQFADTPFLTKMFPYSLLARKTQTMLAELLSVYHSDRLAKDVLGLPAFVHQWRRLTLGKTPWHLNVQLFMSMTIIMMAPYLLFSVRNILPSWLSEYIDDLPSSYYYFAACGFFWIFVIFIINWARYLDRQFTKYARLNKFAGLSAILALIVVSEYFPIAVAGVAAGQFVPRAYEFAAGEVLTTLPYAALPLAFFHLIGEQAFRAVQSFLGQSNLIEAGLRIAVIGFALSVFSAGFFSGGELLD